MLMEAIRSGKVEAVIGRAADFYGPYATNSMLYANFLQNMMVGKKPQLIVKSGIGHTDSCTTDVAKGLVMLALEDSSLWGGLAFADRSFDHN